MATVQAKRCANGTYSLVIGGKTKKTGFASVAAVRDYISGRSGFKAAAKAAKRKRVKKSKRTARKNPKIYIVDVGHTKHVRRGLASAIRTGKNEVGEGGHFTIEDKNTGKKTKYTYGASGVRKSNPKARKRAKRKNPITKTKVREFDVAMNSKAHGWVIVDFGYGDRESAADAAKGYRAEEKRPTKVLMRSKLESPETSAAFLKLKGSAKNPPYRRYGSGEYRVIHRTTGPRHFGSLHHFEKEEDAKKFAKDAKGIYAGKRKTAKKNPKRKRNVPAAFRAAAQKAKAMSPAQRAAWAKKMQLARKRAAAKRKK